jgi:hypothetical protein
MRNRFGIDWSRITGTQFWKSPHLGRRMFFRHIASAVGGYFLLPQGPFETVAHAAAPPAKAKNVIFVLMQGGPSHSDTFDLKEGAWTPGFMAPTSYGDIRFPQGLMPKVAEQMDNVVLLRSVRAWAAVHELGQTWIQIGRNPTSAIARIAPHIGSVVSLELTSSDPDHALPAYISLNASRQPGAGYFEPKHSPFFINPGGNGLGNAAHPNGAATFERRYGLLQELDAETKGDGAYGAGFAEMATFNLSARRLMYNSAIDRIFNFDQAQRNAYGNTGFGNACIAARNILRANMGTRFIQITMGSWDHHVNIYQQNANLQAISRTFDNGLGALINDLKNEGMLENTLVIAMGEFGRTIGTLNATAGRDHFLTQSVLMAGAGIKGRRAIGATDNFAREITEPGWSQNREIRAEDIAATIYSTLGIDWTKEIASPVGRSFEYVPKTDRFEYFPINELWG